MFGSLNSGPLMTRITMIQRRSTTSTNKAIVPINTGKEKSCAGSQANLNAAREKFSSRLQRRWAKPWGFRPKSLPNIPLTIFPLKTNVRDFAFLFVILKFVVLLVLLGSAVTCLFASSYFESSAQTLFESTRSFHDENQPLMPNNEPMPFNEIYKIPESHPQVGDRSDSYALLRQRYDRILPFSPSRSVAAISRLRNRHTNYSFIRMNGSNDNYQKAYDIHNCPSIPPDEYPFEWRMVEILSAWPPGDTGRKPHRAIYQGLCMFQYPQDLGKAQNYRKRELPFIMRGDPHVARTAERWNMPGYLDELLGHSVRHRTEHSLNNHFMYRAPGSSPEGTDLQWMSFQDWLKRANVTDHKAESDQEHWYFRLIGCGHALNGGHCDKSSSEYLFDELPYFQPTHTKHSTKGSVASSTELYMGEHGDEQTGIHCRFGMKGVIAENHFDGGRNAIVLLGGSRRYILSHPKNCAFMSLFPRGHPSARHSSFDWSTGNIHSFPSEFVHLATGNEVVLQAGDAMYLPTFWFHQITSLELNYQCNARSGYGDDYQHFMEECGV